MPRGAPSTCPFGLFAPMHVHSQQPGQLKINTAIPANSGSTFEPSRFGSARKEGKPADLVPNLALRLSMSQTPLLHASLQYPHQIPRYFFQKHTPAPAHPPCRQPWRLAAPAAPPRPPAPPCGPHSCRCSPAQSQPAQTSRPKAPVDKGHKHLKHVGTKARLISLWERLSIFVSQRAGLTSSRQQRELRICCRVHLECTMRMVVCIGTQHGSREPRVTS